jgi:RNA polymerase sigma factor (sigma-70 family)
MVFGKLFLVTGTEREASLVRTDVSSPSNVMVRMLRCCSWPFPTTKDMRGAAGGADLLDTAAYSGKVFIDASCVNLIESLVSDVVVQRPGRIRLRDFHLALRGIDPGVTKNPRQSLKGFSALKCSFKPLPFTSMPAKNSPEDPQSDDPLVAAPSQFRTTLWTVILTAGDPASPQCEAALARLCHAYWKPVYAFICKRGNSPEQAKDLTQGFFAKFLQKNLASRAQRTRGRFRSFLMSSVENFLRDEHERNTSLKRGGGEINLSLDWDRAGDGVLTELSGPLTPAEAFEKQWARTLLDGVLQRLATEYQENGRGSLFEQLQSHLWGDSDSIPYSELSPRFGMSVVNLRVFAHRMRQRFREILREEVAQTVDSPDEIDRETQYLRQIVSG